MIARRETTAQLDQGRMAERLLGSTGLFGGVAGTDDPHGSLGTFAPGTFEGTFRAAGLAAQVTAQSAECVRVTHQPAAPPTGRAALERSARLSGNARLALARDGIVLVADTELHDGAHLAPTLRDVLESFALEDGTLSAQRAESLPALDKQRVTDGLREVAFGEGGVLELEDGWEVRPRLRGVASPVRLAIAGRGLRLRRTVHKLDDPEASPFADAAIDLALRLNLRVRSARLVLADGVLIAEAYLHETQIRGHWIAGAARAVAAADRLARKPVEILNQNADVAEGYAELFLTRHPL